MTACIIGACLALPWAFFGSRFRGRSAGYRLGAGLLVGIGIGLSLNAAVELLELAGAWPIVRQERASPSAEATSPVRPVEASPSEADEASSWDQEQRYDDGTLKARRTVRKSPQGELLPHGPASTYHENGQLKWSGYFEMGRQTGSWKEFFPDGKQEGEGSLRADGSAEETHWHHNGQERSRGTWRNGKKHGEWRTWYPSGQQAGVFQFRDGQPHGDVREWYPNGQLKLQARFEAGVARGPVKRWDERGVPISGHGSKKE